MKIKATKKIEFKNRNLAISFADGYEIRHMVILGDNGKYWVVTPAVGNKLLNQGYEIA